MPSNTLSRLLLSAAVFVSAPGAFGGTLSGHVRDQNWYARRQATDPFGVGYYEFAVNANGTNISSLGGFSATDVFGAFSMANLPAGSYTVASWDVWWRSAFAFNVAVPASGSTPDVDVRLHATMWGYPAFWDETGYYEFGQTFVASGPVSMIFLRDPLNQNFTRTVTVRAGGPGGAQVGVTRTYGSGGDQRLIYGYGDMPTVRGQTYYLRLRTPSPATGAVIMQLDPRPDFSDPMPGGCLWLGNGTTLTPYPDRDLGVVIMSDDDGLITDLFARQSGSVLNSVTNVGQTFVARGVNLISAAFWLADPADPTYAVRVYQSGPGGTRVGTTKRGRPARRGADPEMIVCWAPGECPLTPGQTYYVEVSTDPVGTFNSVYAHNGNPYPSGQAYQNGAAISGTDLAGTLMEEEGLGAVLMPMVQFTAEPTVSEANRGSNSLVITWSTDVASDSLIEYALDTPPYTHSNYVAAAVTAHTVTLSNLQPHALYHFRATSARANYRAGVSRDFVICTKPVAPNLLLNPGFEEGSGAGPSRPLTNWTASGSLDLKAANGSWFGSLPPRSGSWLLEGALNGGSSDATVYQRVAGVTPGKFYNFSAWVSTHPIENVFKYDKWEEQNRLIYARLGVDPTGGTNPNAATVQWTPRFYSHRRYANVAKGAQAQGANFTVFIHMKGTLNYGTNVWHLFGVDDAVLAETAPPQPQPPPAVLLAVANTASNTITLTLAGPANPATATNLANYTVRFGGSNVLTVLSATLVNGTNVVLVTSPQFKRLDYTVVVSNLVHVADNPGTNVLNGQLAARVPHGLIALDAATLWKYNESGTNQGTAWRATGFNDASWPSGAALLAYETCGCLPEPIRTTLTTNASRITFYFRRSFDVPAGVTNPPLRLRHVIDDGAVFHLNGGELYRVGMTNPVAFNTPAQRVVGDAVYEGPFTLTPTNLAPGTNLLAVEVHQNGGTSSDIVFGAALEALILPSQLPLPNAVLAIARQGTNVRLNWTAAGMLLETAQALDGPWATMAGAVSGVTLAATNAMQFFRLREQ